MAHLYFNTSFIENNTLTLQKREIDKVVSDKKNKKFKPEFHIELTFKVPPKYLIPKFSHKISRMPKRALLLKENSKNYQR